ncbi:MAG: DUF2852 domain-containing protein [Pseudomonadota bacterium]
MTQALIRPAWTPVTIAMMVIGFMIFWPLGLAMIAYIIWGDRLEQFKSDVNKATDKAGDIFAKGRGSFANARTGNVAFDDWREAELKRLHEERMKLDEMRAEFDDYARELRRAKDKEEFDHFMAHRAKQVDGEAKPKAKRVKKSGGKDVPGV